MTDQRYRHGVHVLLSSVGRDRQALLEDSELLLYDLQLRYGRQELIPDRGLDVRYRILALAHDARRVPENRFCFGQATSCCSTVCWTRAPFSEAVTRCQTGPVLCPRDEPKHFLTSESSRGTACREREKSPRPPQALALLYMRYQALLVAKELAARAGFTDYKQICRYETAETAVSLQEGLHDLAAALGYPPEAVEALLFIGAWIEPEAEAEPSSPVPLGPEIDRSLDHAILRRPGRCWTRYGGDGPGGQEKGGRRRPGGKREGNGRRLDARLPPGPEERRRRHAELRNTGSRRAGV